jgi:hypothetical protein
MRHVSRAPKIILGVVIARWSRSSAGHTCSVMNWALGFRALGWDVHLVENIARKNLSAPGSEGGASPEEVFFRETAKEFGFENRACLLVDGESPDREAFQDFAADAELFLNYSGQFNRLDLLGPRTRKLYLDVDPAFTQLWVEVCGSDMNFAGHDVFLTVGTNINGAGAILPRAGREWIPTPPPVAAAYWRERLGAAAAPAPDAPWTTVGHWYGYPEMEWQGRKFGGKRESFLAMRDLPRHVRAACAIATDMTPDWDDYGPFHEAGWQFFSSFDVCRDIPTYLHFIASSRGEIGIAKTGYVASRGGWLSDRSMIYLALGRPVLQQDTGWPEVFPITAGLLPFHDVEDCAATLHQVEENYAAQSAAARALADGLFGAERVIGDLLSRVS